jgi:phosphatidylglycerol:prolipoprotein diacylglycerol transferase
LCARLYYCVFEWDNYKNNPISIFYIWQGGLAIYGGVIGAAIGIIVYTRIKKLNLGALLDLVSLGFLIGQSIGRWGNFMNREAFGAPTESFLRMGLFNSRTGAFEYYHPTFLYESVWNAIGFVLLHFLSKRRKYDGQIALGYLAWYGLGRALIEGLRTDSLYLGAFRVSQLLAAVTCAAGVILLMVLSFRYHDPKKLYVNQMAEESAEAAETEETNETEE